MPIISEEMVITSEEIPIYSEEIIIIGEEIHQTSEETPIIGEEIGINGETIPIMKQPSEMPGCGLNIEKNRRWSVVVFGGKLFKPLLYRGGDIALQ